MKYYLILISEGDPKIKGKAIYEYEDRLSALADFHSKLGVAMKSELYTNCQLLMLNSDNGIEAQDVFIREAIQEQPTEASAESED